MRKVFGKSSSLNMMVDIQETISFAVYVGTIFLKMTSENRPNNGNKIT